MKKDLFDLDVQVKSMTGVGTDTLLPHTANCDLIYQTQNCPTLGCPTLYCTREISCYL